MVVADPSMTADQAPRARQVPRRRGCDIDYFDDPPAAAQAGQPLRVHRPAGARPRWPPTSSTRPRTPGFKGLDTRRDPVRDYPADDVAANLVGFMGTDGPLGRARADLRQPARRAPTARRRYEVGGGNRIPLGESTIVAAGNGTDLHTTIDRDLQWYTQRVLRQTVEDARRRVRLRRRDGHPHRRAARAGRLPDLRRQQPAGRRRKERPRLARAAATSTSPARWRRCSRSAR